MDVGINSFKVDSSGLYDRKVFNECSAAETDGLNYLHELKSIRNNLTDGAKLLIVVHDTMFCNPTFKRLFEQAFAVNIDSYEFREPLVMVFDKKTVLLKSHSRNSIGLMIY